MNGYARMNNMRVTCSAGHFYEIPWYVLEVQMVGYQIIEYIIINDPDGRAF